MLGLLIAIVVFFAACGNGIAAFSAENFSASGLNTAATGSIGAGSSTLTLTAPWDVVPRHGVWIPHAGPASTTATPTITSVTANANHTNLVSFTGTPTAGQVLSIQFSSAGLNGGVPITLSYTQQAGDNLAFIAWNFQQLAAADDRFRVALVYVTLDTYPLQNFNQVRVQTAASFPTLTLTLTSSAAVTIAQTGETGASTTVAYKIMARDAAGAFSAPTAVTNATNSGDPTLNLNIPGAIRYNRNPALSATNTVKWTADANAVDVAVCRNNVIVAIVPASEGATTGFVDEGQFQISGAPDFPLCTTGVSTPAPLITTATVVSGTTVTLANSATTAVAGGSIQHDDGAALQAMLNAGCHRSSNGPGIDGFMIPPVGVYNTHIDLTCIGDAGAGVMLQGQGGLNRIGDRSGTFISYWGRGDRAVLLLDGVNGSVFQDFILYGNYIALYSLQLWGTRPAGGTAYAISGDHYNRIGAWRQNASANSAGVMLGPTCANQLSEQFFQGFYIFNDFGSGSAVKSACGGNQKNFTFVDYQVVGYHNAFSGPGTGSWVFTNGIIGDVSDTLFSGITTLVVNGLEAEGLPNSRLATITNGNSFCYQSFNGINFNTPPPSSGLFVAETSGCGAMITNSDFGAGTWQGEYRWQGSFTSQVPLISFNNFWENSTTLPLYLGGNRYGAPPTFPSNNGRQLYSTPIISRGDYGTALAPQSSIFVGNIVYFAPVDLLGGSYVIDKMYARKWITNAPADASNYIDVYGSGIRSRTMPDPTINSVTALTTGALTCAYKIAFKDATGAYTTAPSPTVSVANCASPRNNQIITGIVPAGAFYVDLIDNASGMLVVTSNFSLQAFGSSNWTILDTGQTQTAYSPPAAINNTGALVADGQVTAQAYATAAPRTTACPTANADTVLATDSDIIVNDAAATCTLTMLSAANFAGRAITIKTTQAQTVVSAASNIVPLVGGAAGTAILAATAGKWARLKSNATSWVIMEGN